MPAQSISSNNHFASIPHFFKKKIKKVMEPPVEMVSLTGV
jgi:hypothetical protein